MKEKFRKIWIDPVWSKVIAQTIIYGAGLLILSFIKFIHDGGSFLTSLKLIVNVKIALWIYLLITLLLIFILSRRQKNKRTSAPVFDKRQWGIQITNPLSESKIGRIEKVIGTYRILPENVRIRLFVVNEIQSKCWINSQKVILNKEKRTWESVTYFGSEGDIQKIFYLVIAVDTKESDYWVKHYAEASSASNHWHPFDYPLPDNLIECQKIKVQRIK